MEEGLGRLAICISNSPVSDSPSHKHRESFDQCLDECVYPFPSEADMMIYRGGAVVIEEGLGDGMSVIRISSSPLLLCL